MKQLTYSLQQSSTEKKILLALCAFVVFLLFSYVYLVNKTVWNVVARKNISTEVVKINDDISKLEYSYLTLKNAVSINNAYAMGFKDIEGSSSTLFVTRNSLGKALSINHVE